MYKDRLPETLLSVNMDKLWQSWVPIILEYNGKIYPIKARRQSYISIYIIPIVCEFFEIKNSKIQLDLPWYLPIGVLYDMYNDGDDFIWTIPLKVIEQETAFSNENCRQFWQNSFKEANYILSGSATNVLQLSPNDTDSLWLGIQDNDYETFWGVAKQLLVIQKNIPIRVYWENKPIQKLVSPDLTIGYVLHDWLPNLFPSARASVSYTPIIYGIPIPLAAKLSDLYTNAVYPDGFLHITLLHSQA